jgi:hypothetical protein
MFEDTKGQSQNHKIKKKLKKKELPSVHLVTNLGNYIWQC